MKHFVGGWAVVTLIAGSFLARKAAAGTKVIDCFLWAAIVLGPLGGLAAWGLWP